MAVKSGTYRGSFPVSVLRRSSSIVRGFLGTLSIVGHLATLSPYVHKSSTSAGYVLRCDSFVNDMCSQERFIEMKVGDTLASAVALEGTSRSPPVTEGAVPHTDHYHCYLSQ